MKSNKIKLLILDVDGTLTDGKIYISTHGELMKAFNVKDGFGITKLYQNEIVPIIITGRKSEILLVRAEELKITELYQGIEDKVKILKEVSENYNCGFDEIAYIGDDENDIECMKLCGIIGCPSDALDSVKEISDFVSSKNGGDGAVREFVEYILNNN